MNDFTRVELESILDAFHYAKDSPCWSKDHDNHELLKKIQSLIDNYCEHEFHLDLSDFPAKLTCTKCEIYYE